MSYKKSASSVSKNSTVWSENLVSFGKAVKKRRSIGLVELNLCQRSKMPKEHHIVGRYLTLANEVKSRHERCQAIAGELKILWEKVNFPLQSNRTVIRKVEKVIAKYDKYLRRPTADVEVMFSKLFDITDIKGTWLSNEDKEFYQVQLSSDGSVGYATLKEAAVHPSKNRRVSSLPSTSFVEENEMSELSDDSFEDDEWSPSSSHRDKSKRVHNSTRCAVDLVRKGKLSTNSASQVLHVLKDAGHNVPTPSQSGVHKALYKEADLLKQHFKETLKNQDWCLHFDGKQINGEKQVIVLKNPSQEIRLAVLSLENGKAETIFCAINTVLAQYELWPAVKLIICDTTNTNSGAKNGIVARLQRHCRQTYGFVPQYVGCQHHILDRVLRHAMEAILGGETSSPNLSYPFVAEIKNNYEELKIQFGNQENSITLSENNLGWRDDMKFLHHLCNVFCYYDDHQQFPCIHFQSLPCVSHARWNSRAIFALLAFIILPEMRNQKFTELCRFIAKPWSSVWFSDHCDWRPATEMLKPALQKYPKANKCFDRHWKNEDSVINGVERSNRCAERAIQVLQEIFPFCKSQEKLSNRFILTNNISLP